jgi:hypothetical protein
LSIDAKDSSSALSIAAEEIQTLYGEEHEPILDVLLSLGCGEQTISTSLNTVKITENSNWQDILGYERSQSLQEAMIRLQVDFPSLPSFDDLPSIHRIQGAVKSQIKPETVRDLAARLFTSLFYVEVDNSAQLSDEALVSGT